MILYFNICYKYGTVGRLLNTTHRLNSGIEENTYDEPGRLKTCVHKAGLI
jgi:hypothetical protein